MTMTRDEVLTAEEVEGKDKKRKEELEKEADTYLDKKYLKDMGVRRPCKQAYLAGAEPREKQLTELEKENAELKARIGLSIECDKAQKNGNLCLGYGGDEDEPCEQCKNCIECETGYHQLGETEKDEHLTEAKEIIKELLDTQNRLDPYRDIFKDRILKAEQFLKE